MAYKEVSRVEVTEVIRRWQAGCSQRQIASATGLSRATVRHIAETLPATTELGEAKHQDGPYGGDRAW